jgi:hypothetical protein
MDKYTKGVLTVIAVCLVSITFQLSGDRVSKVAVCNHNGAFCAGIFNKDGLGNTLGVTR